MNDSTRKIIISLIILSAVVLAYLFFYSSSKNNFNPGISVSPSSINFTSTPEITPSVSPSASASPKISPALSSTPKISPSPAVRPSVSPTLEISPEKDVLLDVPFTSQAPFGDWADLRQQDGCEEASALMAVSWARGETLTPQKSLEEILAIADYEETNYGNYHDTNAEDTAEIIYRGYFGYTNIEVRHQIGIEDIKQELFKGNLVVVPANGQKLGNPHYTPPGPLEHNIVIRGYDSAKKEFITNDSGTSYGKNYHYGEKVMAGALMDYPTGYKEPVVAGKTAMIIVKR